MKKKYIVIIVLLVVWNIFNTMAIREARAFAVKNAFEAVTIAGNQAAERDSLIIRAVYKDIVKILDMNIEQTKMHYEYLKSRK